MKNLSTKKKLYIFPLLFIFIVITSGFVFNHFNSFKDKETELAAQTIGLEKEVLKGRISVYQFLRAPNQTNSQKVKKNFNSLIKKIKELKTGLIKDENKKVCDKSIAYAKSYIQAFEKLSNKRISEVKNGIKDESKELKPIIKEMVKIGLNLEKELDKVAKSLNVQKDEANFLLNEILIIIGILATVIFISISIFTAKLIITSLSNFKNGLDTFFKYLNRESTEVELLDDKLKDEFGQMAKVVNSNIITTKKGIEEDRRLIDETITVLNEFEQGDLCQRLDITVSNPALMELKTVLNKMGENMENNIDNVLEILEQYSNYNYLQKIDTKNLKEHLLKLASGVNDLGSSITNMLVENKSNGLTLDKSSDLLLENVDKLNQSSTEAAASLEETSAALEEITSTIRINTENVAKMSHYAHNLTDSAREGENLANTTTTAMEEINEQVGAINDAITVIDQIAFQTNILSLNAAVEAATAGEAGKGFAVVAQEVRNLASRSAEAAKEIKDLVENANIKADEGKNISQSMISGYNGLNDNIANTLKLIKDIETASKEQLAGIEQINDAVIQLDRQTQENVSVSNLTHAIAEETDFIAKLVVSNADEKEFEGKDSAKAKVFEEHKQASTSKAPVELKIKQTNARTIPPVPQSGKFKDTSSSDEWESF